MVKEGLERLVARQARLWEEQRLARERSAAEYPNITISREFGALGAKTGEIVAKRLGFAFYDQELITEIAETEKVSRTVLESVDESVRDKISEWVAEQFGASQITGSKFFNILTRVILTIAHHGKAVIIGRGAQFLLEPTRTLRVRAYAPIEARVRHIVETRNLSRSDAERLVNEMDGKRREFYLKYFSKDWSLPEYYDILINTETYPPHLAASIIVEAFHQKFGEQSSTRP